MSSSTIILDLYQLNPSRDQNSFLCTKCPSEIRHYGFYDVAKLTQAIYFHRGTHKEFFVTSRTLKEARNRGCEMSIFDNIMVQRPPCANSNSKQPLVLPWDVPSTSQSGSAATSAKQAPIPSKEQTLVAQLTEEQKVAIGGKFATHAQFETIVTEMAATTASFTKLARGFVSIKDSNTALLDQNKKFNDMLTKMSQDNEHLLRRVNDLAYAINNELPSFETRLGAIEQKVTDMAGSVVHSSYFQELSSKVVEIEKRDGSTTLARISEIGERLKKLEDADFGQMVKDWSSSFSTSLSTTMNDKFLSITDKDIIIDEILDKVKVSAGDSGKLEASGSEDMKVNELMTHIDSLFNKKIQEVDFQQIFQNCKALDAEIPIVGTGERVDWSTEVPPEPEKKIHSQEEKPKTTKSQMKKQNRKKQDNGAAIEQPKTSTETSQSSSSSSSTIIPPLSDSVIKLQKERAGLDSLLEGL